MWDAGWDVGQGGMWDAGCGVQGGMQGRMWDSGHSAACTGQSGAAPVPAHSVFTMTSSASGSHCQGLFQAGVDVSKGSILTNKASKGLRVHQRVGHPNIGIASPACTQTPPLINSLIPAELHFPIQGECLEQPPEGWQRAQPGPVPVPEVIQGCPGLARGGRVSV